ncbi:thioredoxin-like protein [Xylariaceae sp. FL1651]|nr:thioredoxin-like protein [Xylariaceae sp. FL1651]
MTNFTINIVSDPVCPWCYIGKKRLDRAITLYQKVYPGGRHDTFTISWNAFYLDPSAPVPGISWAERHAQKLKSSKSKSKSSNNNTTTTTKQGSNDSNEASGSGPIQKLQDRLASIGRQEGIAFSFAGKIGNTRSAHRAIAFTKAHRDKAQSDPQVHDRFVMALFSSYFEGEGDITSHKTLADVAEEVGLSRQEMMEWLDGGGGGKEVDDEVLQAKTLGITGVPCFMVQGQTVDGAQDEQAFLEVFVRVKEEEQALAEAGQAKSVISA